MIRLPENQRLLLWFLIKFAFLFCFFYFGTLAVIGLSAPGGNFSPFVARYLDYVSGLKNMMIYFVKQLLELFGIAAESRAGFRVGVTGGKAVIVAMSCVGYGVYSVWLAYILASRHSYFSKGCWGLAGLIVLFFLNVIRISAFLYTHNKGVPMPLNIDHHTWFNVVAYLAIFALIFLFERFLKYKTTSVYSPK